MIHFLKFRWTLRRKLWTIFFFFVSLTIVSIWNVLFILYLQEFDAANINNAGRLRNISQQYTSEFLKVSIYRTAEYAAQLPVVREDFEYTYDEIRIEENVGLDLIGVRQILFKNKSDLVYRELQGAKQLWNDMVQGESIVLDTDRSPAEVRVYREGLEKKNQELLERLEKVVDLFQQNAERKINILKIIQFLVGAGSLITLAIALFVERVIITGPVIRLTDFAEEISTGKFGGEINIPTTDEISTLGRVMTFMSKGLDRSFKEISVIEKIGAINVAEQNLSRILESLISIIVEKMAFDGGSTYLFDTSQEKLAFTASTAASLTLAADANRVLESRSGRSAFDRSRESASFFQDEDVLQCFGEGIYRREISSLILAPVLQAGRLVGCLEFINLSPEEYAQFRPFLFILTYRVAELLASREKFIQVNEILEHIPDGLLTVNSQGKINAGYSRAVRRLMGDRELEGLPITELIQGDEQFLQEMSSFINTAFGHSNTDWTLLNELNPTRGREIPAAGKTVVSVEVYPIYRFNRIWSLLFTIKDLTEKKKLESRILSEQRRLDDTLESIVEICRLDPIPFLSFIQDANIHLGEIQNLILKSGFNEKIKIMRVLHTLKADSASFNLNLISGRMHILEGRVDNGEIQAGELSEEIEKIMKTLSSCESMVGDAKSAEMSSGLHSRLDINVLIKRLEEIKSGTTPGRFPFLDDLLTDLHENEIGSLKMYLKNLNVSLISLAEKTGRKIQPLVLSGNFNVLPGRYQSRLKEVLVHMVRNALDHGIETLEERIAASKPPEGTIRIEAGVLKKGEVFINVVDDGRGIDLEKNKMAAFAAGLADLDALEHMSRAEIIKLIFHPKFSTRGELTMVSGRGMGMNIVAQKVKEMDGQISIRTTPNEGTEFRILLKT